MNSRAVVDRYCVTCHNQRTRTSDLALDTVDITSPAAHGEIWEQVVRRLRTRSMPPQGMPRPDEATYNALASYLETELDRAAAAKPNPGRPLIRRLNRSEYANAIRDLLTLDVDVSTLLPPDDSAFGFDNISDLLGTSPALLERYLVAADRVSALAVGAAVAPGSNTYRIRQDRSQDQHIEGTPARCRRWPGRETYLPARCGVPRSHCSAVPQQPRSDSRSREHPHQLEIAVDGERVFLATVGGDMENALPSGAEHHRAEAMRLTHDCRSACR